MPTQLLIYKSAVQVSRARHGDWSVEITPDYGFTREVNSVPLMAVEFPHAASEYAIVFSGSEGDVLPAVILGVRASENLFLRDQTTWDADYVPAFVRRYPFVFSRAADQFMLCVDEEYPGFNQTGRGQRLFTESGEPSAYVGNVLNFLKEYQAQFLRTQAFCARLTELKLLEPMQAQVRSDSGERLSLGGFMAVNRERLKALPADRLTEMISTDQLELIFLHLHSMRNFERLRNRIRPLEGAPAEAASPMAAS